MIGKKRSGFQITSVTMDYEGGGEGPANGVTEPGGGVANGVAGKPGAEQPPEPGPAGASPRGPPETDSPQQQDAGAAAPRTPGPTPCGSRFRLVKLDGLVEAYRRGRWTCTDLHGRDADGHLLAKALDGARHVNSLDSHLEVSGLAHRAVGLLRHKPHAAKSQDSPPAAGARGRFHPALPSPGDALTALLQAARALQASEEHRLASAPPRPPGTAGASRSEGCFLALPTNEPPRPGAAQPTGVNLSGAEHAASNQVSPSVSQPTSGEHGAMRKLSEPGSTPASPAPSAQDGSPARKTREADGSGSLRFLLPMHSLASSMLSVGAHQDGDDDSGSSSSMVAIDNKIEQAMLREEKAESEKQKSV
ncbi:TSC22 domain family protein 4-like [Rhinoraja longicauda]